MLSDAVIYVPVWLALVGWFVGSFARVRRVDDSSEQRDSLYFLSWLLGSVMIVLHILASYGIAHGWSHAAAVAATAKESEQVTGIRAGWGVYVNFAFAAVWMGYAIAMTLRGRRWPGIDPAIFWFTAAIVVSATILFEQGVVRWLSIAGFASLIVFSRWSRKSDVGRDTATDRLR